MTRQEITAKLAEAFYLFRNKEDMDGSAEGDWRWAEGAIRFFEDNEHHAMWDEWHRDEYMWVYPLYIQITGLNNLRTGGY